MIAGTLACWSLKVDLSDANSISRVAQYLMGENLKVVWAEYSTLS
jgi:hypothetical protein